ncbi:AAA family ATPase [Streptosporangium sandarakinum]|uniref:Energy-coupling factor transporter ATP-binding protein EcfA2 n=1 Tax=Streptosporangium sandarakinum TaxID=1260955 RepID=A0A852UPB9_9ACTN|nr:AAA family ATPase [Streptosporangium sandarakinum]NYF37850.1 energy-coupling factor transporter ATP-binding protein EcfA2 [Streptosporangium sandarakinum]
MNVHRGTPGARRTGVLGVVPEARPEALPYGPAGMRGAVPVVSPQREAAAVVEAVLADLPRHRGVVVDSPPGAGKSTLVVRAAGHIAETGEPLMIVAQTNEQVDDLVDRLATEHPDLTIGRLSASGYVTPGRVLGHPNVSVAGKLPDLGDPAVVVATADKWAWIGDRTWPWAIVDEAYQMRSDKLLRIASLFERALFVGDPGQLDPFSIVDGDRWAGLSWDPVQSAVSVLLRHNPDLPVHRLPVSWRLPASAAPVVSEAFYPFTGFRAGTGDADRALELTVNGMRTSYDRALEEAAASGWALYELPSRHTVRTDAEAVQAVAVLAVRLLQRAPVAHSERGSHRVTADRIAIGAAHRDQVAAIRAAGVPEEITVDTANRLQGREYDMTIVLHPLSGRRDATAFHLESGRLCVLTSRHRHACVVVARAGIPELLDAHPSAEPVQLGVPVKFPDGWEANQAVLAHLAKHRVAADH